MDTHPIHLTSSYIQAAGMRWHVQRAGSGPALLLLHGGASSTHTWRDLLPMLAQHYSILAVDLPGHGKSDLASIPQSSIVGLSNLLAALSGRCMKSAQSALWGHSRPRSYCCRKLAQAIRTEWGGLWIFATGPRQHFAGRVAAATLSASVRLGH
jgi:pimeloyl-ACP methyl ester carboxylesterase